MELNRAIELAYDGNAVLFLGSGFSTGGKNLAGEHMKIGADLSCAICKELGIESTNDLTISSDRYLNDDTCKKSLDDFIDFLKKECTCSEPSPAHETIAKLPWHRIYTTNYDNIFEECSRKSHLQRQSITITNQRYRASRNLEQAIVHINGFIETIASDTFYEEFKISDESYTKDGLLESPWRNMFESDLRDAKAVVFIGYSLQYDQDIVKCIAQLAIKDKCLFIDIDKISPDASYKISRYGTLERIGAQGFADAIDAVTASYSPTRRLIELKGFKERTERDYQCEGRFSSSDVFLLLAKGQLQQKYVSQPLYCIHRKSSIQAIKNKIPHKKLIVIQSYLGNGKTIFLECLSHSLVGDYRVYFINHVDNFNDDMNLVQNSSGESILMMDDGDKYRHVLLQLGRSFPEKCTVIMTCRTAINEHLYYNLIENYGFSADDIYTHDLDVLDDSEVAELCSVLNHSRLWGDYDTLSNSQKKQKIVKEYKKQLSQVFYLMLESTPIGVEISKVMDSLNKNLRLRNFVLAQTINTLCQLKFSYADLCKFTNLHYDDFVNFARNDAIKELIDFTGAKFLIRSPIYLQYMIRNSHFTQDIIQMLSMLFRNCSQNDAEIRRYESQRRTMLSRSDILLVISVQKSPSMSDEQLLFDYYDGIKELPTAKGNPFFWLQFAITTLNLYNFDLAELYFKNAYANAKRLIDFNPYQIDTHYARLLLLREIKTNRTDKDNALDIFYKAHELLYKSSSMGKLDYSLRQSGIYHEYFQAYQSLMSPNEKDAFLCTAIQFASRFSDYFSANSSGTYNVRQAYIRYRKLFMGTRFQLKIEECNEIFKKKGPL